MNESALSHALPLAAAGALLAVFPFVGGKFYVDLMVTTMILAIFALSLELLVGRTGLVSFGHAAFFGIAAYATALLAPQAAAASIAWLLPAVLGDHRAGRRSRSARLSLRTRGIYFIMVTLAFAQMAYFVFHDMKFAGGSDGLYLYVKPVLALGRVHAARSRPAADVLLRDARRAGARLCAAGGRAAARASAMRSPASRPTSSGCAPRASRRIRTSSRRSRSPARLAGVAGFLYAVKDGFVNPEILAWHQSGTVLLMLILGGIGTLRGAVLGAFLFVVLKELFQSEALFGSFATHWQLPLGLTIIALRRADAERRHRIARAIAAPAHAGSPCRMTILLDGVERLAPLRGPDGRRSRVAGARARRSARGHRHQRRRQVDARQRAGRRVAADRRGACICRAATSRAGRSRGARAAASAAAISARRSFRARRCSRTAG